MRTKILFCNIIVTLLFCCSCGAAQKGVSSISPNDFGFKEARNGLERYEAIYKTHQFAVEHNRKVNYSGIKIIDIEIPANPKSIPLTSQTDFNGALFHVLNMQKDFFLFEMKNDLISVEVDPKEVDKMSYSEPELKNGLYLLCIEDANPWIENRKGYGYSVNRKDIILINDGKGINQPVLTYTTQGSRPIFYYCKVSKQKKRFANITLERDRQSTQKTQLVKFLSQNNIRIENVNIVTPDSKQYGEEAIAVYNCTNVSLKKIRINGTYSQIDRFGYGIGLNNVWNLHCEDLISNSNWGIWGNNNVNKIELYNCIINRFDIHCYGRDVVCKNCVFNGDGGLYSSVFGNIKYIGCVFNEATPYYTRPDYNAYVDFNLEMKDCVINTSKDKICIVDVTNVDKEVNNRKELREKRIPNVFIDNLTINSSKCLDRVCVFKAEAVCTSRNPIEHLSSVVIDGLLINSSKTNNTSLYLSSSPIEVKAHFNCEINNFSSQSSERKTTANEEYMGWGYFVSNIRSIIADTININKSRINYNVNDNENTNICFSKCTFGEVKCNGVSSKGNQLYTDCVFYLTEGNDEAICIDGCASYDRCSFKYISGSKLLTFSDTNSLKMKKCKASKEVVIYDVIAKSLVKIAR